MLTSAAPDACLDLTGAYLGAHSPAAANQTTPTLAGAQLPRLVHSDVISHQDALDVALGGKLVHRDSGAAWLR